MKGISISTEVIFLAIVVTMVFLVYTMASPMIYTMQAASVFEQTKSFMLEMYFRATSPMPTEMNG